ncbi:hypothetical protein DPEC_G00298280 [Dallia pectoralis]|uniref:Uncharacterized protein n=1 Tax=Dallia pectoralis TaxID=75939 RepID=A0ACC2FG36_DALPE|nr:hypothetical protein DPEC_G00298280 [Dallia pectoralis]
MGRNSAVRIVKSFDCMLPTTRIADEVSELRAEVIFDGRCEPIVVRHCLLFCVEQRVTTHHNSVVLSTETERVREKTWPRVGGTFTWDVAFSIHIPQQQLFKPRRLLLPEAPQESQRCLGICVL